MRIKRNDVKIDVYTSTNTLDSAGYENKTFTKLYSQIDADLQPVKGNFDLSPYGIKTSPAKIKSMFFDVDQVIETGFFVKCKFGNYIVKGVSPWYSHNEAILEPFEVVL